MKGFTVCAVALALFITALSGRAAPRSPDFALTSETGSTVRLADFRGRVVLVDFWASWCIPCRASFPAIDALYKELGGRGLVVLAINVDEQRRNADAFLASRPHSLTILFDPRGEAAKMFELKGMPSTLLLDRSGSVRFTHMGYTEKTIAQFRAEALALLGES